jgi:hypothetical protein
MLAKLFDVVGLHSPPNKTIQFTMRGRASEDGSRAGPGTPAQLEPQGQRDDVEAAQGELEWRRSAGREGVLRL